MIGNTMVLGVLDFMKNCVMFKTKQDNYAKFLLTYVSKHV